MSHRTFDDPNSIEARQALLDNRCENAKSKRHRVRKRAVKRSLVAKSRRKHALSVKAAKLLRHHARVQAFWAGHVLEHPGAANV